MKFPNLIEKIKFRSALVVCIGLYLAHFINILKYAVNIPYRDEWEAINIGGIIANPTLSQLFAQHNEHRIVTTKLLTLFLYEVDGWNIITNLAVNFIIYGLLVFLLCCIVKKCVPQLPSWILLGFTVFFFSTVSWENHFWAFQTTFHFSLLFLLLSVFFLFNEEQSWKKLLCGIFFSWLAIYSLSSGLIEILVTLFCFTCFKSIRTRQSDKKQREIIQLVVSLFLIGGAIGLYFIGYIKPSYHPALVFPFQSEFWIYFSNLLESGFGITSITLVPGLLLLLFILIPLVGEILKSSFRLTSKHWIIIVSILAVMGALGSITLGRAGFHDLSQSKSPRYCEIVGVLIPLSLGMWTIYLNQREKMRNYVLLAFWLFCVISFAKHWNFSRVYSEYAESRRTGRECVENYYRNGGDGNCPTIYPAPIADRLEFDKTLNLSFIEEANTDKNK